MADKGAMCWQQFIAASAVCVIAMLKSRCRCRCRCLSVSVQRAWHLVSDRHEAFTSYRHLRGAACLHHDGSAEMGCMREITSVAATIEGVGPERPQKRP